MFPMSWPVSFFLLGQDTCPLCHTALYAATEDVAQAPAAVLAPEPEAEPEAEPEPIVRPAR